MTFQLVQKRGTVEFIRSTFGGGWLIAHFDEDEDICRDVMGDDAAPQPAIGGTWGWIIEPNELAYTIEALRERGIEVAS